MKQTKKGDVYLIKHFDKPKPPLEKIPLLHLGGCLHWSNLHPWVHLTPHSPQTYGNHFIVQKKYISQFKIIWNNFVED